MTIRFLLSICLYLAPSFADQLLLNPGFETPVIAGNCVNNQYPNCATFDKGQNIGSWTVVGTGNTAYAMLLLNNSYREGGLYFHSHGGNQNLDLTGAGNQGANGVQQTVTTVAGQTYHLDFYLGNADPRYPAYAGGSSSLNLYVDNALIGLYSTSATTQDNVAWEHFSKDLVASGSTMTLTFINANAGYNYTGLDDVTLNGPSPVPEPAFVLPAAALMLGIALRRLRRA